jgi:hypothetical protein
MKRAAAIGAVGFVAAAALLVVPGATLESFSDTEITPNNAIDATTLEIATGGGTGAANLDFRYDNLLPGVRQSASGTYRNVGRMAQDVWLVFNNADALHALNDLGADAEIHLTSNGTEIFASQNLTANALPRALKLADNVDPGAAGSFSFGFNYSTQFSMNPTAPTAWASLPYLITATQPGIAP